MLKQQSTRLTLLIACANLLLLFSCQQMAGPDPSSLENEQFEDYLTRSKAYEYTFAFDTALLYSDSAISYSINLKDERKTAEAMARKGTIFKNNNEPDSAMAWLFPARLICIRTGDVKLQGYTESIIGKTYVKLGKNDSAIYYLKNAVKLKEEANDSLGLALSLNGLGNAAKNMNRLDDALTAYLRAEVIYGQMGDVRRQAYVLLNIGNIHLNLGHAQNSKDEYEEALKMYQTCKTTSIKTENNQMLRSSSMNIALIYYCLEQFDKAESTFLEVIDLCKESHDSETLAKCYANLAEVYAENAQPEKGIEYMKKALELALDKNYFSTELQAYNHFGIYYSHKGNNRESIRYYQKSDSLSKEFGNLYGQSNALKNLSVLYEKNKDYALALVYFKRYNALSDSIINEKRLEIIYHLESEFEKKKDEAEILRLSNENALKEIKNRDLEILSVTIFCIVILLLGILFFIRLKNKKNKIITGQRIRQLEEEQKLLAAQSVIVGQENERKRIARELHDGIGVLLSTASIHFSNIEESSADEKTAQLLKKANKLLKEAGGQVRKVSHDMMPGVLSKFGLQEALEDVFENVEDTGSVEVACKIELEGERLNENLEIMLYRIVQEMLNNTLKHAGAKRISFLLRKEIGELLISYTDDGKGFNKEDVLPESSLGLSGIKSRVDFLKGEMKLNSSIGKGVSYEIRIPLG
ncbi:MAG: tetratricopeptide repeat protein [Bacteroidales bacterium]|nr:tetratricopeptide repeat protein [Bacteroidales bacterium]